MSENLFLGDTTYPHLPDTEDQPVLVIDAAGNPVLETCGDVKAPANYSFECVNNFVHCEDPHYEELQCLALGMATRIAQLEADLAEARKDQARYQTMRKAIVNCDRKVEEILLQNLTDAGGNDEFDAAFDLAIKEQQ